MTRCFPKKRTPTRGFLITREHSFGNVAQKRQACGMFQTNTRCMERRQGRWRKERTLRASGPGVDSCPIQMRRGAWGYFGAFSQLEAKKKKGGRILPIYVTRCAGSAPVGLLVKGTAVVSGIEAVCAGPSSSLLLIREIRYSSAEAGGASDETIFLPLFFCPVTRQRRRQSERTENGKSADE